MTQLPVYLDHAATTPVRPEVLEEMLPFLDQEAFGNPSSAHRFGRVAHAAVEEARRQVATALGVDPHQVVFTSGGTEADNLAVVGAALAARSRGAAMVAAVSAIEHKAVLAAAHAMTGWGGGEIILPVTRDGIVQMDALDEALARRPAIVSTMWVNNETGVLQPIATIAERCQAAEVPFHTDAVQAFGKVPVAGEGGDWSLLSISGHKIGGPKGIGALVIRQPDLVEPLIHGGGQQGGIRPGTENVPGIVGLGRAAELASREQAHEHDRLGELRTRLLEGLQRSIPDLQLVAESAPHAPHILNVIIPGAPSESMLMHLDLGGVAVSSGSACTTGAVEPSHVLAAMGVPDESAVSAIRFSLGHGSTMGHVTRALEVVPGCAEKVRRLAGVLDSG